MRLGRRNFVLVLCTGVMWRQKRKNDKAIVYVTALFGGGLYDTQKNEAVWEPFKTEIDAIKVMKGEMEMKEIVAHFKDEFSDILKLVGSAVSYKEGSLLWNLTLDNEGNSYNPNIAPANGLPKDASGNVMDVSYGAFGIYKNFVDNIAEKYSNRYDVLIYNQDWRMSPAKSAAELENFIERNGYKEVIFMSHSMGAPVVNNYLARSEANRNKVKLYMGFAPATLGSFDALAAMACPDVYVDNFLGGMDLSGLPVDVYAIVDSVVNGKLGDFFRNNQGLMSLVPSWQLISSDQYDDDNPAITSTERQSQRKKNFTTSTSRCVGQNISFRARNRKSRIPMTARITQEFWQPTDNLPTRTGIGSKILPQTSTNISTTCL